MDKSDDKVTFVYKSEENRVLSVLVTLVFMVILSVVIVAIYKRDYFMCLHSIAGVAVFVTIMMIFYRRDHFFFDKEKKMVYLNEGFFFKKSISPMCSFNKIKEVRIVRGKDGERKFYSEIVIEDTVISSEKYAVIPGGECNITLLFKELIEEAVKVSDTVGCRLTYCSDLPEVAQSLITNYGRHRGRAEEKDVSEEGDYYRNLKPVTGAGQYEGEYFWDREKKLPHTAWWEGDRTVLEKRHSFNYSESIVSIIACPDGETAVMGTHEGSLYIISIYTGKMTRKIESSGKLSSLHLHPNGILLMGKEDAGAAVHVWDLETGRKLYTFSTAGAFKGLYFYPDGERIKILKKHGELTWSLYTGKLLDETEMELMHEDGYDFMASHPGGKIYMEGTLDCLKINKRSENFECNNEERQKYFYHQMKPLYHYDGCDFLARAHRNRVIVWNIANWKKYVLERHEREVTSVSIHYPLVTTGSKDKTLKLWNLETEKSIAGWKAEDTVTASAISPSGFIIYGTDKGKVEILEIKEKIDCSSSFTD